MKTKWKDLSGISEYQRPQYLGSPGIISAQWSSQKFFISQHLSFSLIKVLQRYSKDKCANVLYGFGSLWGKSLLTFPCPGFPRMGGHRRGCPYIRLLVGFAEELASFRCISPLYGHPKRLCHHLQKTLVTREGYSWWPQCSISRPHCTSSLCSFWYPVLFTWLCTTEVTQPDFSSVHQGRLH